MLPSIAAPSFDGEGEPLPGYATAAESRRKAEGLEVGKRASASVSQMVWTARDVRMATGSEKLVETGAVGRAPGVPGDYVAPDTIRCPLPKSGTFFAYLKGRQAHGQVFGQV